MHWLKITAKKTRNRDIEFLVKLPLIPNRYRIAKEGKALALYKPPSEQEPYLLQTDSEDFYQAFRSYYHERFEVSEHKGAMTVPQGYELLYGSANGQEVQT